MDGPVNGCLIGNRVDRHANHHGSYAQGWTDPSPALFLNAFYERLGLMVFFALHFQAR